MILVSSRRVPVSFVGAQHAAPLPLMPQMRVRFSPVTSHHLRVTRP